MDTPESAPVATDRAVAVSITIMNHRHDE